MHTRNGAEPRLIDADFGSPVPYALAEFGGEARIDVHRVCRWFGVIRHELASSPQVEAWQTVAQEDAPRAGHLPTRHCQRLPREP